MCVLVIGRAARRADVVMTGSWLVSTDERAEMAQQSLGLRKSGALVSSKYLRMDGENWVMLRFEARESKAKQRRRESSKRVCRETAALLSSQYLRQRGGRSGIMPEWLNMDDLKYQYRALVCTATCPVLSSRTSIPPTNTYLPSSWHCTKQ